MPAGNLSQKLPWDLANPRWASILNPIIENPVANGILMKNLAIKSGLNVINHGLGEKLQGYIVVMNSAAVIFYDSQSTNSTPSLTLNLIASGATTISLYVF